MGPRDLDEAAALVARALRPPFQVHSVGAREDELRVGVPVEDVLRAEAWFERHPIVLADGTQVTVRLEGLRAELWTTFPVTRPEKHPAPLETTGVQEGLPVEEAARRANAAGWLVRAFEPDALRTLDRRSNRVNLCYGVDGIVTSVSVG